MASIKLTHKRKYKRIMKSVLQREIPPDNAEEMVTVYQRTPDIAVFNQ